MRRSYKFHLRPAKDQRQRLQACFEDHRKFYHTALKERQNSWW